MMVIDHLMMIVNLMKRDEVRVEHDDGSKLTLAIDSVDNVVLVVRGR